MSSSPPDEEPILLPYEAADGRVLVREGQEEVIHRAEQVYSRGMPLPCSAFTTDGRLAPSWQPGPEGETPFRPSYDHLFEERVNENTGVVTLKPIPNEFTTTLMEEEHFFTFKDSEETRHYREGAYDERARGVIKKWIEDRFIEKGLQASIRFTEETIAAVARRSFVDRATVNPPGFFCLANGHLDLTGPTPVLLPFNPDVRLTFRLHVAYDPTARCPRFLSLLEQMLPDPPDRALLQEMYGYLFIQGHPYKKAFFFLGPTNTGKSMLHEILRGIVGNENVSATSLQDFERRPFSVAELYGKLAIIYSDLPPSHLRAVDKLLLSVGRDLMSAERKYENPFDFINQAKLYYSANRTPTVKEVTDAFWERWLILRFTRSIPKAQQIPNLADTLLAEEGAGILNWMLEGRARLLAQGGFTTNQEAEHVRAVWKSQSAPWDSFVETRLVADPMGRVSNPELWAAYVAFCDELEVPPDRAQAWITQHMTDYFPHAIHFTTVVTSKDGKRNVRMWRGVRLLSREGAMEGDPSGAPSGSPEPVQTTLPSASEPAPANAPQNVAEPSTAHPKAPEATSTPSDSKGLSWVLRLRPTFTLEDVRTAAGELGIAEERALRILEGLRTGGLLGPKEGPFRWPSTARKGA